MPSMPAFCNTCGTIFRSPIAVDGGSAYFKGNECGPCPKCGGKGHIPDGLFDFVDNTIKLISGPEKSIEDFKRLVLILEQAKFNHMTAEHIEKKVAEEVPSFSGINKVLKDNEHLATWINLLISILFMFINSTSSASSITKGEVINNIYNQSVVVQNNYYYDGSSQRFDNVSSDVKPTRYIDKKSKIGRNDPCRCGSGKKYRKCCGKNLPE